MSSGEAMLWVLGGLTALTVLVFIGIFIKFIVKATVSYLRSKPYPALAIFALPGGLASFIAAYLGAAIAPASLIGLAVGAGVLLLVAMELGAD